MAFFERGALRACRRLRSIACGVQVLLFLFGGGPAAAQPPSARPDFGGETVAQPATLAPADAPRALTSEIPPAEPVPAYAAAEAGDGAGAALTPELQSILQRLDALEKEAAKQATAADKPPESKPASAAAEKKSPDVPLDKWNVKLGGHMQMDWIHWPDASPQIPAQDYFEFRRLRLLADGAGYGVYDFRLQIDVEPEGGDGATTPVVDVKDAYFSANQVPLLDRWRIGNFFVPFSLEQVTNDTMNIFLERSIPTQGVFAADREVGMAFYGVNDAQDFTFTSGVFFDGISESLKERIDDNQGTRFSGRATWLPYYDESSQGRHLVHLGSGVLFTDDQDGVVRFRARPQIHEGPFLIDTGSVAASDYVSGNVELATVWGPFSVQSELFLTGVNRAAGGPANLQGGYVHGSCFLTGENRLYERYGQHGAQFGRTTPRENLFLLPGCYGWGAWELKARYSQLDLEELAAGRYDDFTFGFNHYWSDRIRVMFDWIHPVASPDSRPLGDAQADVIGMRFDWNW